MSFTAHPSFLRNVLFVDAATCVTTGALMTLAASYIGSIADVPPGLLFYAGLSLFPIAAFIGFVATRATLSPAGVWLVIIGNVAWVAGSLWLLLGGPISPNAIGYAFIALQAVAVAGLAELEYVGVRRIAAA